jgi:uncharacterized protein
MIVDLRRLDEAEESCGRLEAEETVRYVDASEQEYSVRCGVELNYKRGGGVYFFHGRLKGKFDTVCHYCLDEVSCRVEGEFDVVVRKTGERESEKKNTPDDEETENLITLGLNESRVSFDQYINENVIVNIPMQILCKEDCNGLCPQCGINRNHKTCDCGKVSDPRWDALRNLKKE